MFITHVKTVLIEAIRKTFDGEYPNEQFRDLWTSQEFPAAQANYPGIWVNFATTAPVQSAGINHVEQGAPGELGGIRQFTRWRFSGIASYTAAAFTSAERDLLADEFVKIMAFGLEDPATAQYRRWVEDNGLIGISAQWDQFDMTGSTESQGTPWGTDETIYEVTINQVMQGEIASTGPDRTLVPLSAIRLYEWAPPVEEDTSPSTNPNDWQ